MCVTQRRPSHNQGVVDETVIRFPIRQTAALGAPRDGRHRLGPGVMVQAQLVVHATTFYTAEDDGLAHDWYWRD